MKILKENKALENLNPGYEDKRTFKSSNKLKMLKISSCKR
jgi:hypothetical protein